MDRMTNTGCDVVNGVYHQGAVPMILGLFPLYMTTHVLIKSFQLYYRYNSLSPETK